jgi:DNA polymerase alpha-associated DNA helicase A
MYKGAIVSDSEVKGRSLNDLLGKAALESDEEVVAEEEQPLRFPIMLLIDTRGCGMKEDTSAESNSHRNLHEADIVLKHVTALLIAGVPTSGIGVITPYNGQLEYLKGIFNPADDGVKTLSNGDSETFRAAEALRQVDVKTIDGFQVIDLTVAEV